MSPFKDYMDSNNIWQTVPTSRKFHNKAWRKEIKAMLTRTALKSAAAMKIMWICGEHANKIS